jgi:tetratricopeptide (TPR) repeat protein
VQLLRSSALVAVALLIGCSGDAERAESARQEVREALARGNRATALDALGDLRDVRPDTPEALLELTGLMVRAGEAPQSVWLLEEGVRRFPERADLRLALAQAALLVNDASRARAVLALVPEDSEYHEHALLTRGQAELQLGDLEAALATFEEAERRHPEQVRARVVRIATLLKERRSDEARALLTETKREALLGEGREAIRRLEVTLYGIDAAEGRTEAAIAGLRRLVEDDPGDAHAWRTLVPTLWRVGRAREAEELLTAALDSDPELLDLYPMLALVQAALGRADEAEKLLRVFADRSQSPSAYVALAQFYTAREDPDGVLAVYREALAAFPEEATLRRFYTEALVSAGRLEEARGELARFREAAPSDPHAEYLRARIELAGGDATAAARRLEKWMPQLDGGATQFWLGRALEAMGDEEGAARRYGLAISRAPSDPAPYFARIALAERRGDWRAVIADAHQLVQRSPARFDGWRALVTALLNLRDGKQAEPFAARAALIFPDRSEIQILLAVTLRTQGRHAEALTRLEEAADRFGPTPEIEAERALTQGMSGQLGQALATVQTAIAESPDSALLFQAQAALLFGAGQAEAGARATDRALELAPDDPRPLRTRAEFRVATGRQDGAQRDCERYLELRPADPGIHYILAAVHEKAGRSELAIASYRRAAELDEAAFAPRNNLAVLLAAGGDLDGALAAAQEAFAIADDNPYVMDTLGELYLRKGRVDRAISLLEDAHAAAPELPDAQLHLALAYREAGESERARALLADLRSRSGENGELRARVDEALESL